MASIVHALTVLVAVIVLAPLIGYLPMAGLAALLLLVAWNMSEVKHFAHILRVAPRSDAFVLVTCFVLTVVFDMVVAVSVGVVLAALLFMRRMAEITHTRLTGEGTRGAGPTGIPAGLEKKIAIYDVAGPLFFGAAQKAVGSLAAIDDRLKALIVRLDQVPDHGRHGPGRPGERDRSAVEAGLPHRPDRIAGTAAGVDRAGRARQARLEAPRPTGHPGGDRGGGVVRRVVLGAGMPILNVKVSAKKSPEMTRAIAELLPVQHGN